MREPESSCARSRWRSSYCRLRPRRPTPPPEGRTAHRGRAGSPAGTQGPACLCPRRDRGAPTPRSRPNVRRNTPTNPGPRCRPAQGKNQYNFTDPDIRIMPTGGQGRFEQTYIAQAAVEVDSRLIVGQRVAQATNDQEQLVPTMQAIAQATGPVKEVLSITVLPAKRRSGNWSATTRTSPPACRTCRWSGRS